MNINERRNKRKKKHYVNYKNTKLAGEEKT